MKNVISMPLTGVVKEPSLGLAAAPEIAIAVPSETPRGPPYPGSASDDTPVPPESPALLPRRRRMGR